MDGDDLASGRGDHNSGRSQEEGIIGESDDCTVGDKDVERANILAVGDSHDEGRRVKGSKV